MNFFLIDEPLHYHSQKDEDVFFEWLQSPKAILKVIGTSDGLEVYYSDMDDKSLRELIALLFRYKVNPKCLKQFCNSENEHWFKNTDAFWFDDIFN